jgi:hypothetical protein
VGDLRERNLLEDLGVDGRIILEWIFDKYGRVGIDRIVLVRERDRWRSLVNTVMKFQDP